MPVIAVNAAGTRPVAGDGSPLAPLLDIGLANLPKGAPVVVMIHGFRFAPDNQRKTPHTHILSPEPARGLRGVPSWPRRMGFGRGRRDEGLGVSFGWNAAGSIWAAYDEAARAGRALAGLIAAIRLHHAGPVHLMAHSLGARVALSALGWLPAGSVGRIILLAGAEFRDEAQAAMATPAGRGAEVLNVTSRENDLFDFLFERLVAPRDFGALALGAGVQARGWVDLQIDAPDHQRALARLGFPTAPATRRVCHWSGYLRPGLFPFYRAFLRQPAQLPLGLLRAALPERTAPRWSRLLALPLPDWLLPLSRKAPL